MPSDSHKLHGLFLTLFDPTAGIELDFEVPEGVVSGRLAGEGDASVFEVVKEYLIPKDSLYGHLVTVCTRLHKVIGFPVKIVDSKVYEQKRNSFSFNVSWVFPRNAELAAYEPLVRKTGRVFEALERSSQHLSQQETRTRMHAVLEQLYEDLNSYAETSIVLDGPNVLDLRLFPSLPNPAFVRDWDVPVPLVDLDAIKDLSWDLTLYRVLPYINGVNSVRRIATAAQVEPALARSAVQHLVYFSCAVIVDLFQYSNSYALVSGLAGLPLTCGDPPSNGEGLDVGRECAAYVAAGAEQPDTLRLLRLYACLQPGERISEWLEAHHVNESEIDVRRMVQFGIIKGFLRRVHLHPIWLKHPAFTAPAESRASSFGRAPRPAPAPHPPTESEAPPSRPISPHRMARVPPDLPRLLDGTRHSDELCVRFKCSLDQLLAMLRAIDDCELVYI